MPKEKHVKNHNAVLIEDIEREQDKTLYIEFEAEIKELENSKQPKPSDEPKSQKQDWSNSENKDL